MSAKLIQIHNEIDCSTGTILHDNLYGLPERHFAFNHGHIRFHCLHLQRSWDYSRSGLSERAGSSWRQGTAGRDGQQGRRMNGRDGPGGWISLRNTSTRWDLGYHDPIEVQATRHYFFFWKNNTLPVGFFPLILVPLIQMYIKQTPSPTSLLSRNAFSTKLGPT